MAISSAVIPYSWFNISAKNQNFGATYRQPTSSGTTGVPIAMPDGNYTVDTINAFIQQQLILYGCYLIDANGNNVYYLQVLYNPTYYAVQIVESLIPLSLPTGWTAPINWPGYPSGTGSPTITLTAGLGKVLGFSTATIGSETGGNQSFLSTSTPQGSIVNSLIIRSNLVDNQYGVLTDILDTMPITSAFGTNLVYAPNELKWVHCTSGVFQSFEIYFCDQNYNQIYALDNNICISILLKNGGKTMTSLVPLTFKE
jgi:hypothetical protein